MDEVELRMQLARVEYVIDRLKTYTSQLSEISTRFGGGKSLEHHFLTLDEFLDTFHVLKVGIRSESADMKGQESKFTAKKI